MKPITSSGYPKSKGLLNPRGNAISQMAFILDYMLLFGFGFRDAIGAQTLPILPIIYCI